MRLYISAVENSKSFIRLMNHLNQFNDYSSKNVV